MSLEQPVLWGGFFALLVSAMALDLFVLQREAHAVSLRAALVWSAGWIGLGLAFGGAVFAFRGTQDGIDYMTGYLVEKSLSVDNLFVFLVIFQFFAVPASLQPKALRWGIIGALVFRFIFILSGATLLNTFHWMVFVFGAVLLVAAYRLASHEPGEVDPSRNPALRLFGRVVPVTKHFHWDRFFLRLDGTILATPLFVALLAIETTDIVFAVDSVPAVLAITSDPFIVFTSNAFAILGLRALYFVLADVVDYFRYLRYGLVAILGFVGAKMMVSPVFALSTVVSLGVICAVLVISIAASLLARKTTAAAAGSLAR